MRFLVPGLSLLSLWCIEGQLFEAYFHPQPAHVLHIVTFISLFLFLLSFLARALTNIEHFAPMPPLVPNISGVKLPYSSLIHSPYSVFLLFSLLARERFSVYWRQSKHIFLFSRNLSFDVCSCIITINSCFKSNIHIDCCEQCEPCEPCEPPRTDQKRLINIFWQSF